MNKNQVLAKRVVLSASLVLFGLLALYFLIGSIWRFSGSNNWELQEDSAGVAIYSLKTPGVDLVQFRAITRLRASLSSIVAVLSDPQTCSTPYCSDAKIIERPEPRVSYFSLKLNMMSSEEKPLHALFRTRDAVARLLVFQNPDSKEILMKVSGAPEMVPLDECCFRVTKINNHWKLKPLGNGEVQVEWLINTDMGGFLPHFMMNAMYSKTLRALPSLLRPVDQEKYRNAKFDFVTEP